MSNPLIPLVGILSVFGMPTVIMLTHMRLRHREKMRQLEGLGRADAAQVAALESARSELEARVRTLESIVTAGDHDLEARLRQLTAQAEGRERQLLSPPRRDPAP